MSTDSLFVKIVVCPSTKFPGSGLWDVQWRDRTGEVLLRVVDETPVKAIRRARKLVDHLENPEQAPNIPPCPRTETPSSS